MSPGVRAVDEWLESPDYTDLGSCAEVCELCNAQFWFGERVKSVALNWRPQYNGCCKVGKVVVNFEV